MRFIIIILFEQRYHYVFLLDRVCAGIGITKNRELTDSSL